jgi:hypothetical protein
MKYYTFLFLVLVFFGISGCFIADDAFGAPKEPILSLKQKIQNSISVYVKENSGGFSYYKYGFSELIIYKPEKIVLLDNLIKDRNNKELDQNKLEKQISDAESEVIEKDLRYTIEMDHVYSLTNKKTGNAELYESRFLLTDSLTVDEVTLLMNISMNNDQESMFADYFYETTIFLSGDYKQNKDLSREFYTFFKKHQEKLNSIKKKSDFLTHTLWLCQQVKKIGMFNQNEVLEKLSLNRIRSTKELIDYESIKFSRVYEINDEENLKGYYFFHKFSHLNNINEVKESVVYIGFSLYYEITEILQVEKPYKHYFDE